MSQAVWRSLTIRAGDGARVLDSELGGHRRRYSIRVHSDGTGADIRFDFTDSLHNEAIGVRGLGPSALLEAFAMFVSDADSGANYERADFLEDFGYVGSGAAVRQGLEVFKACQASARKFGRLFSDGREAGDVLEALRADGIDA